MTHKPEIPPVPPDFPVPGRYAGVDLAGVGRIHVWQAADPAALLDDSRYIRQFEDCNELMPYWADLWPSAPALSEKLIADRYRWQGGSVRALEIGAGLGVPGLVMAKLGIPVTLTDAAQDALAILNIHLRENGLTESGMHQVAHLDYFQPENFPEGNSFTLIVGTDVLFEARNCHPLANTIKALLAPGGEALIADPFRTTGDSFCSCLKSVGLSVTEKVLKPPAAGSSRFSGIRLFTIT